MKKALIVVDYQFDFADPKGKLYVSQGETIKQGILEKIEEYKLNQDYVIFSGDFHPSNHVSFAEWGEHCLVGTSGVEFYVDSSKADLIIKKGTELKYDSYSAFYVAQELNVDSGLDSWLKQREIKQLEICGLALDVCVQATYDDSIKKGYESFINYDLSKKI
ncbi:isochorismatase family protein [Spiroplasma sp. BIUS-1]|uniref:isochorismatase family protein n=1 Tax=Spiroplasma sp. BIUS-1 TaxID=216964 RepID=UPI001398B539|nr:isochorismatase family protein [Spiroplasma sp. BIUS-1]QHX36539.1 nicotinamidase/pyrazinamidase [Spiroplasma sp. BIUS-1]